MNKVLSEDCLKLSEMTEKDLLNRSLTYATKYNKATVFWRFQGKSEKNIVIDTGSVNSVTELDLETVGSGFVIYPFHPSDSTPGYFIKNDVHIKVNSDGITCKGKNSILPLPNELFEPIDNTFKYHLGKDNTTSTSTGYQQLVKEAVQTIQKGAFKKVVIARNKKIKLNEGLDPVELFLNLCATYPNSFISLTCHPEAGTWMGASPEILLSQDETTFRTVALAATQHMSEEKSLSQAVWAQKEIEEQALVSRYIINCFKKIRLREFEEEGPKTVQAGSLIHLRTDFSVNLKEVNIAGLGSTLLQLLHPTSAVCGMPKEEALKFILSGEGIHRKFYSGYLGPVNIDCATDLFVNIRCAQLLKEEVVLYAGAGITAESDPEKEYQETEWKMKVLEKFINTISN